VQSGASSKRNFPRTLLDKLTYNGNDFVDVAAGARSREFAVYIRVDFLGKM